MIAINELLIVLKINDSISFPEEKSPHNEMFALNKKPIRVNQIAFLY